MFWKKKEEVPEWENVTVLDKYIDKVRKDNLENNDGRHDTYLIVKTLESLTRSHQDLNKKLDLILNHLNLQYVPETEKKEPAKLVEKKTYVGLDFASNDLVDATKYNILCAGGGCYTEPTIPKKKRGRPKKK